MTFYEAAIHILEREGKPLDYKTITERAIAENLLSHVGKIPEETMLSRLLAMARRGRERKIIVVAPGTFALTDWGLNEDVSALAVESKEPDEGPPLRPTERHPEAMPEIVLTTGRERQRKKARKEERGEARAPEGRRKGRKYPPLTEVAYGVLTEAQRPLSAVDLTSMAREKGLVSDELGSEMFLSSLRDDNQRRLDSGRKPAFAFLPSGEVALEAGAAPLEAANVELQLAFAEAIGVPLAGRERGRPERGREGERERERDREVGPGASRILAQAADHRRTIQKLIRRRLNDLDASAFEVACLSYLDASGFKELKVAKRSKEGVLALARRREGLLDLRCAVRLVKGGREIAKQDVVDLRKEMAGANAQMGFLFSPGEVHRDAKSEAQLSTAPLVFLYCGEALAEKMGEAHIGATVLRVEVMDLDEQFFRQCRDRGGDLERRREERRRERGGREEPREGEAPPVVAVAATELPVGTAAPPPAESPPGGNPAHPTVPAEHTSSGSVGTSLAVEGGQPAPASSASETTPAPQE